MQQCCQEDDKAALFPKIFNKEHKVPVSLLNVKSSAQILVENVAWSDFGRSSITMITIALSYSKLKVYTFSVLN